MIMPEGLSTTGERMTCVATKGEGAIRFESGPQRFSKIPSTPPHDEPLRVLHARAVAAKAILQA